MNGAGHASAGVDRRQAQRAAGLLDAAPDALLDGFAALAAQTLACPLALASVADGERIVFRAAHGLALRETPGDSAFCTHAVANDTLFEVPEVRADRRFVDNPLVCGEPAVRFYAGMPVCVLGHRLGTLCVLDRVPRSLSAADRELLGRLARLLEDALAARLESRDGAPDAATAAPAGLPPPPDPTPELDEAGGRQGWLRKLWSAVDQAAESVIVTDLAGTIEYVNDAAVQLTGYPRDELLGQNPRLLKSGRTPASVYTELWRELHAGRRWKGVFENRRKDGSALVESASITPVRDVDGRLTHYVAVKQDVTENRELHAELAHYRQHLDALVAQRTAALERARVDAEAANAAKSAFLAAMSHEIRTPMNGVIGVIELLERSSLTPDQKELTDAARESAAALLTLIDEILDFSKIEAGHLALEDAPLDPAHVAESACDALQPVASARAVQLHVFVDPALPAQLRGDAVRLRQIVTNLVANAIKFSAGLERPGRVSLRVHWQAGGGLTLAVADNGIGMDAAVRARLFRPFEQGEVSTTRMYGGTGLGLAICRRLTDAMGGRIELESTPGSGSRFEVTLPLAVLGDGAPALAAHDLSGLDCRLFIADAQWARDWAAYLRAAGARAELVPELPLPADSSTVCVAQAELLGGRRPAAPAVILRAGERRAPREESPQRVSLDVPGVRRDTLVRAVAIAAGRALAAETAVRPEDAAAGIQGRPLLVAEDNATNRTVLARQLRLMGLEAEFAEDGEAALALWRAAPGRYALLLTDLHMPRLDGYALCAAVRAEEGHRQRLPIVALTANALPGEVERCRRAGMDDYLSKPVQIERLRATLLRWMAPAHPGAPVQAVESFAPPPAAATPDFDPLALQRLIGHNPALVVKLRRDYLDSAGKDHAAMQDALARGDASAAAALAHRLKSSSRTVGALALGQMLEAVERAGRPGEAPLDAEQALALQRCFADACARLAEGGKPAASVEWPRVLLVDDDPVAQVHLPQLLRSLRPIEVEAFGTAQSMLERLGAIDSRGCLALLDLNMPGMDGIELVRHLAEVGFQGALALVSGADRRLLETAVRLGRARGLWMLGYLHKPVAAPALQALLEGWHESAPGVVAPRSQPRSVQEVERAIRGGEIGLMFQPQIDLRSGALAGVEALARWQHPRDGLLPPAAFVPVAEEHGLVDALTRRVLDLALRQQRVWRERHALTVRVSVNVSMENLVRLDFPEYVVERLAHHRAAAGGLVLEVTESRLMKDLRAPAEILTRLRLRGIALSIDDFGTGHSSLAQLRDLPFDELKVDRGFVHGGQTDPTLSAIMTGSVEMAQQLGLRIVAEGVEDVADWQLVRSAGCTVAQGFLVGRPMTGEDLPAWLQAWPQRWNALVAPEAG